MSPHLRGSRQIHLANDLWHQARVQITQAVHRLDQTENLNLLQRGEVLRNISTKLITNYNQKELMKVLAEALPKLNIGSCFLSLYEKDGQSHTVGKAPEWSRLILAFNNNQIISIDDINARFLSKDLVPSSMISDIKSKFYIIESLYFRDVQIGFVLFEPGPKEGYIYENLRDQLSSALYGSQILEERSYVKEFLDNTLTTMQTKASTVSLHSKNISDHVNGISTSMEEVTRSITEIGRHINEVMDIINEAVTVTNSANNDIIQLTNNSKKIGEVVDIINDIAEQTSVLALNAAIQASHAGDVGKCFNVVAGEVKGLSQKTVDSTREIFEMITINKTNSVESAKAINSVVGLINQISELSATINVAVNKQTNISKEVYSLLVEAARGSNEIADAITEIAKLGSDLGDVSN